MQSRLYKDEAEMKRGLKIAAITAVYLVLASGTFAQTAQNPDPSKWMCRNLADSGGYVYQGETIFGSQACRPIPQASTQAQAATSPTTVASAQTQPAPASAARAVPVSASSSEQTQATIYFYRPRRFQGAALRPSVFVDDARVGHLHNGDSVKVSVATGGHRIYSTDKSTGMELDAKAGETYYVRVDIQVGFFKGHGGVTLVDPQQGKYEVAQAAHQGADDNQ
ncbi:MAG: DUF2846 domain-containing protein [Candidatus Acidiferrales bacterium]